jgi:hypothetical protein
LHGHGGIDFFARLDMNRDRSVGKFAGECDLQRIAYRMRVADAARTRDNQMELDEPA